MPRTPLRDLSGHLRWVAPTLVLCVAAILRVWALDRPGQLVFDELYYVRDAVSQLAHGFPTTWPDDTPVFGGEHARAFSDTASAIAHPPLGKWLIGLGILLLGADTGWGWRAAVAVAGVASVGLTIYLGRIMTGRLWVGCLAGLLLAIDGVHVTLSRVALLDGFLTLLVLLGALCIWQDQATVTRQLLRRPEHRDRATRTHGRLGPVLWRRPWLLAAGLTFGAAAGVKWSGLYPLAAFLVLITVRDLILRRRLFSRPVLGALRQAGVTAALALPAALLAYLTTWLGWIITPGGQYRSPGTAWWVSLWEWHTKSLSWHSTLTAEHPYQASPLGWPLALRPTAMYWAHSEQSESCRWADGCVMAITSLPNPLVTWGGVLALALLVWVLARALWRAARPRRLSPLMPPVVWAIAFLLVGYASGWLPWVFTFSRSAVFQFYAVVLTPFSALALAFIIAALCEAPAFGRRGVAGSIASLTGVRLDQSAAGVQGRRLAAAIFVVACVVLAVLFAPLWMGVPVAEWFWRAHLWLPSW